MGNAPATEVAPRNARHAIAQLRRAVVVIQVPRSSERNAGRSVQLCRSASAGARPSTIGDMRTEASPPNVLTYAQASEVIRLHAAQISAAFQARQEETTLLDSRGRVLAAPIYADRDQPPFDRTTRDGFACRAEEISRQPLRVVGLLRAGEEWLGTLASAEALEIMTGAPVPSGADCVVMVEHTSNTGSGNGEVRLLDGRKIQSSENIVPRASEAHRGTPLLPAGIRLAAQHIALAASCGQTHLKVFRKPRVAVQATGDELVEITETPLPFQIRNSNSYSLAAQVTQCGAEPLLLPILRDDCIETVAAITSALAADADLIILSGGVSMGKFDFVEEALHKLGAEFLFTGAKIQPGKPVVFGRLPRPAGAWTYFFGLPGNPISTLVTFALFVHPLLNTLSGEIDAGPRFALARLAADVSVKRGLTRFLPAILQSAALAPGVTAIPWQGSGDMAANARANCYLVVPDQGESGSDSLKAGVIVSVLLIG